MQLQRLAISVLAASLTLNTGASAAGLPVPKDIGASLGVSAHGLRSSDIAALSRAGFKYVRIDLTWEKVEREKGVYNWGHYEHLVNDISAAGLTPFLILDYGNRLYSPLEKVKRHGNYHYWPAAPTTAPEVAAFSRYASAAAKKFKRHSPVWELWNEADVDHFWPPKASPRAYTVLALSACRSIRRADPGALIVGPGAAHVPTFGTPSPPMLTTLLKSRGTACLDAISVHPYGSEHELNERPWMWDRLRSMAAHTIRSKRSVIASEWGASSAAPSNEHVQARYFVKMAIINHALGIPITIWYDYSNDGSDQRNREHNFGLVTAERKGKPAMAAATYLLKTFKAHSIRCHNLNLYLPVKIVSFSARGRNRIAVWNSTRKAAVFTLPAKSQITKAVDIYGAQVPHTTSSVSLSGSEIAYLDVDSHDLMRACR